MSAVPDADTHVPPAKIRASDAERLAVAEVLQDAVGRGLLNPTEGSERTAAAFAAVYRDDLGPLTADLPPVPRGRSRGHHGRRGRRGRRDPIAAGVSRERGRARAAGSWDRAQRAAARWWLAIVGVVAGWSPRRRVLVAVAVALLLVALLGLGLTGHDGVGRGGPRGGAGQARH